MNVLDKNVFFPQIFILYLKNLLIGEEGVPESTTEQLPEVTTVSDAEAKTTEVAAQVTTESSSDVASTTITTTEKVVEMTTILDLIDQVTDMSSTSVSTPAPVDITTEGLEAAEVTTTLPEFLITKFNETHLKTTMMSGDATTTSTSKYSAHWIIGYSD